MSLLQLLITAASFSAAAGGSWGLDRLIERHARITEAPAATTQAKHEEEEESGLLY